MLIYMIWAVAVHAYPLTVSILMLLGLFVVFLCLIFWVISCFPENMRLNDGRGSSMFLDNVAQYLCFCCPEFAKQHFGSDYLVGAWILTIMSVGGLPYCLYSVIVLDKSAVNWLTLASDLCFLVGSLFLVHVAYPNNFYSDDWTRFVCFCFMKRPKRRASPTPSERSRLIPNNPTPTV